MISTTAVTGIPLLELERALGRARPRLVGVEGQIARSAKRESCPKCFSPSAVPQVATTFWSPAWFSPITSV